MLLSLKEFEDPSSSASLNNVIEESPTPIGLTVNFEDAEEIVSSLSYEPDTIRGKKGQRLWHVNSTRRCVDFCKSQLNVILWVNAMLTVE